MKLKKIISDICNLSGFKGDKENLFYYKNGVGDKENKKSDFFHFILINYEDFIIKSGEDFNKNITILGDISFDNEKLVDLNAFDKNLSMFIFVKLEEDYKYNDMLKKQIYRIEEDGYSFNKFVICYKESQIKEIDNIEDEFKKLSEYLEDIEKYKNGDFTKQKFIFDLVCGLSFLKINFSNTKGIEEGNRIIENVYINSIIKEETKNKQIGFKEDIDFSQHIEDICIKLDLIDLFDLNVNDYELTEFEENLLKFGEDVLYKSKDYKKYTIEKDLSGFINNERENGKN